MDKTSESISRVMHSGIPIDRLDHMVARGNIGDNVLLASFVKCQIEGGNPLIDSGGILTRRVSSYLKYINEGEKVIINKNGGHCTLLPHWIVTPTDAPIPETNYYIADKPSLINLENDPELEKHTEEYFEDNNLELSYVKRLRNFYKSKLINVFKEFKSKGGYGLYVYTTGIDKPQMYEYCEAAIEANLTDIYFEFNAGIDEDHNELIESFKNSINIITI